MAEPPTSQSPTKVHMGRQNPQIMDLASGGWPEKSVTSAKDGTRARHAQRRRHTTPKSAPYPQANGGFANPNNGLGSASDEVKVPHVAQRNFILHHSFFQCLQLFFSQIYGADITHDLTATAFTTHTESFGTQTIEAALKSGNTYA